MKKTLGAIGLLSVGVLGISSFANGQTTGDSDSQLEVSCAGDVGVDVSITDLDLGSIESTLATQTEPETNTFWAAGPDATGIYVSDTLAGCTSDGTSWDVTLLFSNLTLSGQSSVLTLTGGVSNQVDVDGNGNMILDADIAEGNSEVSPHLTHLEGAVSTGVVAKATTIFEGNDTATVIQKDTADTLNGTYELRPEIGYQVPGSLKAGTYVGTIEVAVANLTGEL